YYSMIERDGKLYETRHQIGFEGKETNREEKRIDFVIGSGNHARTYLHRTSDGKLVELPVSWYSEMGGYWGMSPGYDRAAQRDFRRAIGNDCMFCHNGYPEQTQAAASVEDEPSFGAKIPEGIGCQRCHGPGLAHVKTAMSPGSSVEAIRAAIVNPARLGRDRQMEVCMECHLETTSSPLPNSIRRYEREPFSYRPGEPLADYELTFDHKPGTGYDDRFEVAHQAYRLRKSACFLNSEMTCITCHNPHQALRGEEATKHYVAVCVSCHTKAHSLTPTAGRATCLDCHMWKRRTDDVVHVVMTDHYIQRIKPKRDLVAPLKESVAVYHDEVIPYYPKSLAQVRDGELYLAVAQVEHDSNLQAGIVSLRRAIEQNKPSRPEFYLELGKAYSKSGDNAEAIQWFEEALRRRHDFHPALREMSVALAQTGNLRRAAEVGERAAAELPLDTVALTNLGNLYLRMGRAEDARRVLEQALSVNPDLADANNLLGMAWMNEKNATAAESSFRNAIRIQPDLAEAHNNLGNLLAGNGDYAQASFHFEKAIENNSSYVEAYHSYGLLLAMAGSLDKAITIMNEAVQLDPKSAPLHTDLGDILMASRRAPAAQEQYSKAIQFDPNLGEAYLGLGNAFAAQGADAEAETQFRLALEHNSQDGQADLALAGILTRRGDVKEAREHYQKAAASSNEAVRRAALEALR
ncbi:MAG: tetratricopeptide repeat protein, partial [Edaphobacter sp.]